MMEDDIVLTDKEKEALDYAMVCVGSVLDAVIVGRWRVSFDD